MRVARQGRDGAWHIVIEGGTTSRIAPLDWNADLDGHWPLVEFTVRELGAGVGCPRCGAEWSVEEMDCIFGSAGRRGNDVVVLVRCAGCQLPHRLRLAGFVTAYPDLMERMAGWAAWPRRQERLASEEAALYGDVLADEEDVGG